MRKTVKEFLRRSGFKIPDEKALKALLKLSSLTEPQLEVLLIEAASTSAGMKLAFREKAKIRGVAKGAYARTLRQAIENIKKSIFTSPEISGSNRRRGDFLDPRGRGDS